MKILTPYEVQRLLAVIPERSPFGQRDKAMIVFCLHSALRVSELCGLRVHHVAHDGVPRQRLDLPRELAKGNRSRVIPLNEKARQAVAALLAFNRLRGFAVTPDSPLLYTREHKPVGDRAVRALMQKYRELAGLDVKATPHTLRHTAASWIVSETGNPYYAKEILGHRGLNTITHYVHTRPMELARAMDQLAQL